MNRNFRKVMALILAVLTLASCFSVMSFATNYPGHEMHVTEVVKGKAATTCEDGLTDGVKCNACGGIMIVPQEVIKAKGHPSGEWVYDKRPTYKSTGIKHRVCSICGKSYDLNTVADKVVPDVNLDTKVNSSDALLILQTAVGKDVYIAPQGLFNADANGDTKINSSDALIVLQISVGIIK